MTTPLPPNDPPSADEPLPGEAELAALYRELPRSEPSSALDAAVLRAAAGPAFAWRISVTRICERNAATASSSSGTGLPSSTTSTSSRSRS